MIKRVLFFLILFPVLSFGVYLKVKGADVVILVDGKKTALHEGDMFQVSVGSQIDFVEGDGRVVINKRQLRAKSRIKSYKIPENSKEKVLQVVLNDLAGTISENSQKTAGLGRKGSEGESEHVFIATPEVIIVESQSFGPLPVTASVFNEKGDLELELINEDDEDTIFSFDKSEFKAGSKLVITNAFDDELVSYIIK